MELKMEKVNSNGRMVTNMKEISMIIKYKVMVKWSLKMVNLMKVNGMIIKWMVKVYLHGQMVEDIKDIFKMIKRMDLV